MSFVKPSRRSLLTAPALRRRIDAGMGRIPCDLVLRNARVLDVFTLSWRMAHIGIMDDVVVLVEPTDVSLSGHRERDLRGMSVVPGFIDAHVHLESSLMVPRHFEAQVLPRGTTSAICDPHELANVCGPRGIEYFLRSSPLMAMDLDVMISSCVPATHLETNGAGVIDASELVKLRAHDWALGLAEMMNVPGVLGADPAIMEKILGFQGTPLDGHAPLVRGSALSAYAAAGISSCHESSQREEAREKISKGVRVWIREGSVAKDLRELIPLLNERTLFSLGFCTDDRNPLDIADQGHLDFLLRESLARGVAPEVAYTAASFSVARHYGLDRGPQRVGAIAPGYLADLVILSDAGTCAVESVVKRGKFASEILGAHAAELSALERDGFTQSVRATVPELADLRGPAGLVHVMGILEGKIITTHEILEHDAPGVCGITVLERYGRGSAPVNAYVKGFGQSFRGAIGSSVGHDSHNLIVAGTSENDKRVALAELIAMGGGFCVVKDGVVAAKLPLPLGGLMSQSAPDALVTQLRALKAASRAVGCELSEPFLQLAFLSLPVIPSLKLTDQGLVDVEKFAFIPVAVS